MTDLIYPKTSHIDDGCDWTKVIIWRTQPRLLCSGAAPDSGESA